jgi:outer membrane receptor for monomeric catechols
MPTGGSENNRIRLAAYWKLFARINYNFTADWQAFVQVKNLLDEQYLTPAISSSLTQGIPNHGREFLLGLVWQY